jgi:hypothetical protein
MSKETKVYLVNKPDNSVEWEALIRRYTPGDTVLYLEILMTVVYSKPGSDVTYRNISTWNEGYVALQYSTPDLKILDFSFDSSSMALLKTLKHNL